MKKKTFPNFNYHHKNNKVRIIGIDPGLGRVGYGIIEIQNEKKVFLDCGVIETNKNKEEGELSPQLLDRFGMSVEVKTVRDAELRVKVVDQRTSFDDNPDEFSISVEKQQDDLQQKVIKAQEILNSVQLDDDLRLNISAICGELDVDGLRGDIVCLLYTSDAADE